MDEAVGESLDRLGGLDPPDDGRATGLIVEDAGIQGGAATFRGTRILVHQIADLLRQGVTEAELLQDYPRLTRAMIAAAPVYTRAYPRQGRALLPSWRTDGRSRTTEPPRE